MKEHQRTVRHFNIHIRACLLLAMIFSLFLVGTSAQASPPGDEARFRAAAHFTLNYLVNYVNSTNSDEAANLVARLQDYAAGSHGEPFLSEADKVLVVIQEFEQGNLDDETRIDLLEGRLAQRLEDVDKLGNDLELGKQMHGDLPSLHSKVRQARVDGARRIADRLRLRSGGGGGSVDPSTRHRRPSTHPTPGRTVGRLRRIAGPLGRLFVPLVIPLIPGVADAEEDVEDFIQSRKPTRDIADVIGLPGFVADEALKEMAPFTDGLEQAIGTNGPSDQAQGQGASGNGSSGAGGLSGDRGIRGPRLNEGDGAGGAGGGGSEPSGDSSSGGAGGASSGGGAEGSSGGTEGSGSSSGGSYESEALVRTAGCAYVEGPCGVPLSQAEATWSEEEKEKNREALEQARREQEKRDRKKREEEAAKEKKEQQSNNEDSGSPWDIVVAAVTDTSNNVYCPAGPESSCGSNSIHHIPQYGLVNPGGDICSQIRPDPESPLAQACQDDRKDPIEVPQNDIGDKPDKDCLIANFGGQDGKDPCYHDDSDPLGVAPEGGPKPIADKVGPCGGIANPGAEGSCKTPEPSGYRHPIERDGTVTR